MNWANAITDSQVIIYMLLWNSSRAFRRAKKPCIYDRVYLTMTLVCTCAEKKRYNHIRRITKNENSEITH